MVVVVGGGVRDDSDVTDEGGVRMMVAVVV